MNVGQLLRTGYDLSNPKGLYKAYNKPEGAVITAYGQQVTIGRFASEITTGWLWYKTAWTTVNLLNPVKVGGLTFTQAVMRSDKLFPVPAPVVVAPGTASPQGGTPSGDIIPPAKAETDLAWYDQYLVIIIALALFAGGWALWKLMRPVMDGSLASKHKTTKKTHQNH